MTIERRSFLSGVIASIGAGMVKIATPEETSVFAKGMEVTAVETPSIAPPSAIIDPNLYINTKDGFVSVGWIQRVQVNAPVDDVMTCDIVAIPSDVDALYRAFTDHVESRGRALNPQGFNRAYRENRRRAGEHNWPSWKE